MENNDINNIWKSMNSSINKSWSINEEKIISKKISSVKRRMLVSIIWEMFTFLFYATVLVFLLLFIIHNFDKTPILISCSIIATWIFSICQQSIFKLYKTIRLNYSKPVKELLDDLKDIQFLTIKAYRTIISIAPFYLVFVVLFFHIIWDIDIMNHADSTWLIINIGISIFLILPFTIWGFRLLRKENINKPWMQKLLKDNSSQIIRSIKTLESIESVQ